MCAVGTMKPLVLLFVSGGKFEDNIQLKHFPDHIMVREVFELDLSCFVFGPEECLGE